MGETADQTRDEIVKLRSEMSAKVVELRHAAERPVRIAKSVAVGAVALVVIGGIAMVVISARRRAERRSLKGRLKIATAAAAEPDKTAKRVKGAVDKKVEQSRAKLREELKKELKDQRPLHEKVLTTAIQSAAKAAVPVVIKKLEERTGSGGAAGAKTGG